MHDLKIDGMTCDGCVTSIKKAILSQDSKASVQVDLQLGRAKIDSQLSVDALKTAIEDAGFDVSTL